MGGLISSEPRTALQDVEWEEVEPTLPGTKMYRSVVPVGLKCIVGKEPEGWHISVSGAGRYPTWDELSDARYRFVPNRARMVMHLPPREEFVNFHSTTLHLFEARTHEEKK